MQQNYTNKQKQSAAGVSADCTACWNTARSQCNDKQQVAKLIFKIAQGIEVKKEGEKGEMRRI